MSKAAAQPPLLGGLGKQNEKLISSCNSVNHKIKQKGCKSSRHNSPLYKIENNN